MKTKIILDTDIGTDIDDAVALAYLLNNPNCDLLGITTVTGEAEKRAMIASAMCIAAGKDIPIYPGAEKPLIIEQNQKEAQQASKLVNWEHKTKFPKGEAIEFLRHTIRKYPGEVVLLTIAPLTNIGLLFSVDPDIPSLLKGLVMMSGYFERKNKDAYPMEWNAFGDYHASKIVYDADVKIHKSVGLDVTTQVTMSSEEVRERFKHPLLMPVLDFAQVWFDKFYPYITFHDPLAAVSIFSKNVCGFTGGNVSIEMNQQNMLGLTYWEPSESGRHQVALEVNKQDFFGEFFGVFKG
ncbi:MAG: nucleoside hydrolase [Bacteroidota bacterium]